MNPAKTPPAPATTGPLTRSGNKPVRGPTLPKSTTTNRIALSSGPAVAASEARKNKKTRNEEAQDTPPEGITQMPTLIVTPILVPLEAVTQDTHPPIVAYQSSDQGNSPPPFTLPDFMEENSATPPATPTRRALPPTETDADVPMHPLPQPLPTPQLVLTPIHDIPTRRNVLRTQATPRPLAPPSEEAPPTPAPPVLPPILIPSSTKNRLKAAADRNNTLAGKFTARNALDKYTAGPFPAVHDAHPSAVFEDIDTDFAAEWEQHQGGKLLAHPFDGDAQDPASHEEIRELIFTAASEITKSVDVEVSAPMPSKDAKKEGRSPTIFLIFNLSDDHANLLLQRGVWSSAAITFRVLPFRPPCPNFMFSIGSISTHSELRILPIVQQVWDSKEVRDYISALINAVPGDKRGGVENAICLLMDSMWIRKLETKRTGETIAPHYNIYTDSSGISIDEVWTHLRGFLSKCTYSANFQGTGKIKIPPFHCGVCHGADHPRGLCPFPDTPGWNGPKNHPNLDPRNRRDYRPYSTGGPSRRPNRFLA